MSDGVSYGTVPFPGADRFTRLGRELGVTSFGLNVVTLTPGQRMRIHRHEHQEEVYVVLAGTLTLAVEAMERTLEVGEVARVAPEVRRQLVNLDPSNDCVVLAIGGHGEHASRDAEAFETWGHTSGRPPQDVPLPPDLPLGPTPR